MHEVQIQGDFAMLESNDVTLDLLGEAGVYFLMFHEVGLAGGGHHGFF